MKTFVRTTVALMVCLIFGSTVLAQPPGRGPQDGRQRGDDRNDRGGHPPRRDFRPPPHPLEQALDANGDEVISADEIANAVKALKSLDKNGDGSLDREELRPARPPHGDHGGHNGQPRDGQYRGEGQHRDGPPHDGRRPDGPPPERGSRDGGGSPFVDRIMQLDKNGDGKLTAKELPEQMRRMVERGDKNDDGALDRQELEELTSNFQRRSQSDSGRDGGGRDQGPRDQSQRGQGGRRPPLE